MVCTLQCIFLSKRFHETFAGCHRESQGFGFTKPLGMKFALLSMLASSSGLNADGVGGHGVNGRGRNTVDVVGASVRSIHVVLGPNT